MPMYDFRCPKCLKEVFDLLVGANTKITCPNCGTTLQKVFNRAPTFQLKGTGFYETDFKNK